LDAFGFYGFLKAHTKFAGYKNWEEYLKKCNPINYYDNISIPTMCLSAEDDVICLPKFIRDDLAVKHLNTLLLRTK